jgi:hypothetical protein
MPETILSNRILSSLTSDEYSHLAPHLKHVSLGLRQMLRGPSVKMDNAYFFTSGMASHVVTMRDGSSVESGIVGREAMSGLQLALGYDSIPGSYSSMQIAGSAFRIAGTDLKGPQVGAVANDFNAVRSGSNCSAIPVSCL